MGLVSAPAVSSVAGAATLTTPVYDSTDPSAAQLPSLSFEATGATEIGNQVAFAAGTPRSIDNVVVSMDSWGCGTSGSWSTDDCVTAPGATFAQPITLNLYNVNPDDTPGSLIGSVTQTVDLAYRPSADATHCTGADVGKWYNAADSTCYNGIVTDATLSLGGVTVPDKVIYGVEIRTSDYGDPALGGPLGDATACHASSTGCPYDSLNVALSLDPDNVSVGSDPVTNGIYWNTSYGPNYCDSGSSGTGTFRLDAGCWGDSPPYTSAPYDVPAVQFNAVVPTVAPSFTSAAGQTIYQGTSGNTFTVTASGTPAPTLAESGALPSGISFDPTTGVLSGSTHVTGTFPVTLTASNVAGTATQSFVLTVLPAAPAIASANAATFVVGQPGSFHVSVTGAPTPAVSEKGTLPAGVTFDPATDTLSGTPGAGTGRVYSSVKFFATSSSGRVKQLFTLTVDQAPAITTTSGKLGKVGTAFNFNLKASGFPKPTFSSPSLPPGVTITNTGNGKATLAGHYLVGQQTFTIVASNGSSPDATQTFTLSGR